jgi:hypothetical protein
LDATTSRFDRRTSTYQDRALQQFLFGPAQETALRLALEVVPQARRILDVGCGTDSSCGGHDRATPRPPWWASTWPRKWLRDRRDQPRAHSGWDARRCQRFPEQRHRSSARPRVRHFHAAVPTDLRRLLAAHRLTVIGCDRTPWFRLPDVQIIASATPHRRVSVLLPCGLRPRFAQQVILPIPRGVGLGPTPEPSGKLDSLAFVTVNRTQALVLGFFLVVWVSLLLILVAAPEVFDQALRLPTDHRWVELAVLAGLSGLIGLLAIGVVRRWRWTFWLILVAFLFGVLRVPAAVLQFTGILATNTPTWYVTFQALLGVVQFGIGLVMVIGYRRSGAWGAF